MFHISEGLLFGLLIIPILAFLIIVHELGHFFAARSVGVTVEEFGIGLPPRAKGWRWRGVLWSLNWIPFGGFVRVKGEDGTDVGPGSMNTKKPWQRAWFLVAGPLMNFIAAIVLSIVLVGVQGLPSESSHIYIDQVAAASPAQDAGWHPGDTITAVNGEPVTSGTQLQSLIKANAGKATTITIQRGKQTIQTTVTPRKNPPANQGATGIQMSEGIYSRVNFNAVDEGSLAQRAGLRRGDQLISVNGVPTEAAVQGTSLLENAQGTTVPIVVRRDGKDITLNLSIPTLSIILTGIGKDSPAEDAGLFNGDHIMAIGGTPVPDGTAFQDALIANSGKTVTVDLTRNVGMNDGTVQNKALQVQLKVPKIGGDDNPFQVIGVNAAEESVYDAIGTGAIAQNVYDSVSATDVIPEGWNQFWGIATGTIGGLRDLLSNGVPQGGLVGPVGMGQLTSELLTQSPDPKWVSIVRLTILISVSLGIMNLLPLPALDGGRLTFVIVEFLRGGKKIAPEKEGMVHLAGMVILLGLMFFVAFGDVSRLFDGTQLLP